MRGVAGAARPRRRGARIAEAARRATEGARNAPGRLIALAGGPGESATPLPDRLGRNFFAAGRNRDLVVFDQRGTGLSGALRCRSSGPGHAHSGGRGRAGGRVATDARARRAFYTTRDSVDDIEAVRAGARRREDRPVRRLLRDQGRARVRRALPAARRAPGARLGGRAGPARAPSRRRARRDPARAATLCARSARTSRADPVADIARAGAAMRAAAPVRPTGVGQGPSPPRAGSAACGCSTCSSPATSTPPCGAHFPPPCAPRSRRPGAAAAPRAARRPRRRARAAAEFLSDALYAATVCEEGPLPWAAHHAARPAPRGRRGRPAGDRRRRADPFDRTTALFASRTAPAVQPWPSAPARARAPDGRSRRCPRSCCRARTTCGRRSSRAALAARIPGATLVSVPEMGHSVLSGSRAPAGCAPWTTSSAAARCAGARRGGVRSRRCRSLRAPCPGCRRSRASGRGRAHGDGRGADAGRRAGPGVLRGSARLARPGLLTSAACVPDSRARACGRSSSTTVVRARGPGQRQAPHDARPRTACCACPGARRRAAGSCPAQRLGHRPPRRPARARRAAARGAPRDPPRCPRRVQHTRRLAASRRPSRLGSRPWRARHLHLRGQVARPGARARQAGRGARLRLRLHDAHRRARLAHAC